MTTHFEKQWENYQVSEIEKEFIHVPDVFTKDDILYLKARAKEHLLAEQIPCFTLIDRLNESVYLKLKSKLEEIAQQPLYYLNDFYLYTDESFKSNWHMDTELFTFKHALNAWILLSPDQVEDPLGFVADMNESPDDFYHSVKIQDGQCKFGNYKTGKSELKTLESIESDQIHTPKINLGDLLVINPRRFHKTNFGSAKHCLVLKFVYGDNEGVLSDKQVSPMFWPEVRTFNKLVNEAENWDGVIDGMREALKTEEGRKALSSGFYPEKFSLYEKMVQEL